MAKCSGSDLCFFYPIVKMSLDLVRRSLPPPGVRLIHIITEKSNVLQEKKQC